MQQTSNTKKKQESDSNRQKIEIAKTLKVCDKEYQILQINSYQKQDNSPR